MCVLMRRKSVAHFSPDKEAKRTRGQQKSRGTPFPPLLLSKARCSAAAAISVIIGFASVLRRKRAKLQPALDRFRSEISKRNWRLPLRKFFLFGNHTTCFHDNDLYFHR